MSFSARSGWPSSAPPRRPAASAGRSSGTCSATRSAATVFPVNPKRAERARASRPTRRIAAVPDAGRPGRHRHARADRARRHRRVRRRPACAARSSSRPASRRPGRRGVELERQVLEQARRGRMRVIGPNCLGVMNPLDRPERHLRRRHGPARQRRLHQPERRALHRRPRLEPASERRLQRVRLDRLDARRRLGRPDRLPRRRPAHARASSSTWSRSATRARSSRRRARWR